MTGNCQKDYPKRSNLLGWELQAELTVHGAEEERSAGAQ